VAWHSLQYCGHSRKCEGPPVEQTFPSQALSSLLVVQTDVFFVLSAYLTVVGHLHEKAQVEGSGKTSACAPAMLDAVTDAAAAVLRRVVRTAPMFVLAASLDARNTVAYLLYSCWPDIISGVTWPYGKPFTWPFAVDLLCLSTVRVLLAVDALFGEASTVAATVVLLASCLERRRRHGPLGFDAGSWHLAHLALGAHRLPLHLVTLLLTLALARCGRRARLSRPAAPAAHAVANGTVVTGATTFNGWPGLAALADSAAMFLAWFLAAVGVVTTAAIEWCWRFGPRKVLPWWIYPFPAKLPLLVGCVLLLEASRCRAEAELPDRGEPAVQAALGLLERRSLAVLVSHEIVEMLLVQWLPGHTRDLRMFFFQLPSLLFCSFSVASVLTWVEEPVRSFLERGLRRLHSSARGSGPCAPRWRGRVALGLLLLPAGGCTALAFSRTCGEPYPSPCFL